MKSKERILREARDQGPFLGSVLKGNMSLYRLAGWAHKTIPQNHTFPRADGSDVEGRQLHAVLTLLPSIRDNDPRASLSHDFSWVRASQLKALPQALSQDVTDKSPERVERRGVWVPAGRERPERRWLVGTSKHHIQDS